MDKNQFCMKKNCILWLSVCLIALMGCSGETYVGELPDEIDDNLVEPIPIVLGLGVPSYEILTRGSGPFENTIEEEMKQRWENSYFYVYAFNKDPNTDLRTTWSEANESVCLLDGNRVLKDPDLGGKITRVNIDNTSLMPFWPDEDELKVYYNMKQVEMPYNFFAYYLDDSPSTLHREKEHIYFDVEVDGRRDFMLSVAEPTDDQLKKIESSSRKQKILESTYSAYSANRGMNPVFRFKHQLARFNFRIYSGEKLAGFNKVENLVVDKIELSSRINGKFIVAVNDPLSNDPEKAKLGLTFEETEEPRYLALCEKDGSALNKKKDGSDLYEGGYRVEKPKEDTDNPYERVATQVGGSLLVSPCLSYVLRVYLTGREVTGATPDPAPIEYVLVPPAPYKTFEAGKMYSIRIALYGQSTIEADCVPSKWGEGGSVTWEPDNDDW